jgi:thiamine biosynthesis lipoprotein
MNASFLASKVSFRAMGCGINILLGSDTPQAVALLQQVPDWFEEWEQCLSRFRPDSELNWLNRMNGAPVVVSQDVWDVINLSLEAARKSDGLITPAVLPALEAAGYDRSFEHIRESFYASGPGPAALPDWKRIEMQPAGRLVYLPAGMRLDLGGVAKGWAALKTAERLAQFGSVMVDAGGDIMVLGDFCWPVGISDPGQPDEYLAVLGLSMHGLATSGQDYRRWKAGETWQHHIIDPRTGRPAETDVISASVVAPDVQRAEMAAKVVLILGSQSGLTWLENQPDMAGLVVLENGLVLRSKRLKNYLDG